jgi:hypothetical protein
VLASDQGGEDQIHFVLTLDQGGRQLLPSGGELVADRVRGRGVQLHRNLLRDGERGWIAPAARSATLFRE